MKNYYRYLVAFIVMLVISIAIPGRASSDMARELIKLAPYSIMNEAMLVDDGPAPTAPATATAQPQVVIVQGDPVQAKIDLYVKWVLAVLGGVGTVVTACALLWAQISPKIATLFAAIEDLKGRADRQAQKTGSLQAQLTDNARAINNPATIQPPSSNQSGATSLETLLMIVILFAMIGVGPFWGYSHSWGFGPSGLLAVIFILLICRLLGLFVVVASCMFLQSCATDTGDPVKDRRGRITNAVGQEVFNTVFQAALGAGVNALAGRNGTDIQNAVFASVGQVDFGAAIAHVINAANDPSVNITPVAKASADAFLAANPQTPADKAYVVNTIGAAIQTAANTLAAK